ncbi:MAG: hypothetical protein P1P93_10390 [Gammaproteobacteria bacterium]|nr:hypothetical protein [Gammaproteobacteria bacterium]
MTIITKPSKAMYKDALSFAEQIREREDDPHRLAHVALYLAQRNEHLEAIYRDTEAYMKFGQDPQLHANLVKAMEKFEDYEVEAETMEDPKLGLG